MAAPFRWGCTGGDGSDDTCGRRSARGASTDGGGAIGASTHGGNAMGGGAAVVESESPVRSSTDAADPGVRAQSRCGLVVVVSTGGLG